MWQNSLQTSLKCERDQGLFSHFQLIQTCEANQWISDFFLQKIVNWIKMNGSKLHKYVTQENRYNTGIEISFTH